jgi:hypothetical protein
VSTTASAMDTRRATRGPGCCGAATAATAAMPRGGIGTRSFPAAAVPRRRQRQERQKRNHMELLCRLVNIIMMTMTAPPTMSILGRAARPAAPASRTTTSLAPRSGTRGANRARTRVGCTRTGPAPRGFSPTRDPDGTRAPTPTRAGARRAPRSSSTGLSTPRTPLLCAASGSRLPTSARGISRPRRGPLRAVPRSAGGSRRGRLRLTTMATRTSGTSRRHRHHHSHPGSRTPLPRKASCLHLFFFWGGGDGRRKVFFQRLFLSHSPELISRL